MPNKQVIPFFSKRPTAVSKRQSEYYPPAIEIGSASLKLLQIARTKKTLEISKAAYYPLNAHLPSAIPRDVRNAFKEFIKDNQIKGKIVTSLPINKIQTFTFTLSNMPESEIASAVAWKLKQNLPAGTNFANLSVECIPCLSRQDDVNKDIRVLVFVVTKEVVMEYITLFREFSLEPIAVEPKPYATLRALLLCGKISKDETVIVLQLGSAQSAMTIVHLGQPYLIRSLPVAGNIFTEVITQHHQLDWQKAEAFKKQEGLKAYHHPNESTLLPALASQLENLLIDIEHTFKYFSHQLMKLQVTSFNRIILCGGSAALPNLDKFLSDRLEAPVEVFRPFDSPNLSPGQELNLLVTENSASFASVLGLAARDIE